MAEVIGVIGSTIAIAEALIRVRRYGKDVYHADIERRDFSNRLDCVESVLKAIDGSKAAAPSPNAAWVQELDRKGENSPVQRLLGTLKKMECILTVNVKDTSMKAKLKKWRWHSEKKELDVLLNQVKDHCNSIMLVLQWGLMELSKAIGVDVKAMAVTVVEHKILTEKDKMVRETVDASIFRTEKVVADGRVENQEMSEVSRKTAKMVEDMQARLIAEESMNNEGREKDERKHVEKWLSPLEFQQRQQVLFEKAATVQKGRIGKWFFECDEFNVWKQGIVKVLRGYGEPGAGKTILASVVVEELVKTFPETPVLCVYFEKTEGRIQTPKNIQGSLLKQLIQFRKTGLSQAIRVSFEKGTRTGKAPSDAEIPILLKAEIESHSQVFVVIDGLDEATEESRQLIERDLPAISRKLSTLTMARKDDETDTNYMCCDICEEACIQYYLCKECAKFAETPDDTAGICPSCKAEDKKCIHEKDSEHILEFFTPEYCEVLIETPDDDIALYLKASIEEDFPQEAAVTDLGSRRRGVNFMVRQCYRDPSLFARIVQHIVDNADGRFLLAREYIKHFRNKNNMRDIEAALENKEDDGTEKVFPFYTEDMERIMKQEYENMKLAVEILSIMFFAKRNLTLAEILQAHATRDGDTSYKSNGETEMREILYATKGLVTIERITSDDQKDNSDMIVRFEHLTRREYFAKYWTKWFPTGKVAIAKTCLTFLSFDAFSKPCTPEEEFQSKEKKLPFVSYAVQFWGDHVREAGPGATEVVNFAVKYLQDPSRVEAFIEAAWTANTRDKDKWDVRRTIHPLHICAWFDLGFLMPALKYDSKSVNVREKTHGQTPLMYACRRGNTAMVRRLLDSGASVNTQSEKGRTALFEAILRLKKNPTNNSNLDIEKSLQIVNLLLDEKLRGRQLDINMCNPKHLQQSALIMSVAWKQIDIALAILGHPSLQINMQDLNGESALHIAAGHGLVEVVQEILQMASVTVDLPDKSDNRTALLVASRESCKPEVVEALLKHGADPCWKDKRGGMAVLRAAEAAENEGREESFAVLVKSMGNKLDLKCVDEDGRGLWHWASAAGSERIIEWLRSTSLDLVNTSDATGMTPLHEACMYDKLNAARLLLQIGADPTIRDASGRTPVTVACQYGNAELIEHFKSTGLNEELQSGIESTAELPLWSLAMMWKLDAIRLRIASDPMTINTVEPRTRRTALHCALLINGLATENEDIQVTIVRELLATGKFSPDDMDSNGQTPLHLAAMYGNVEAMKLLLSNDADIDVVDRYGMAPLRVAFKNRFLEVGILLIEAGAIIDGTKLDLDELLFAALNAQDATSVRKLMAEGANRMAQDEDGRTAEMAAKGDPKLLGILKSSKSHRFKAATINEKRENGIELIEDAIDDVENMLKRIKGAAVSTAGEVLINGKAAKSVRFTPFSSGEMYFGNEEKQKITPLLESQPLAEV